MSYFKYSKSKVLSTQYTTNYPYLFTVTLSSHFITIIKPKPESTWRVINVIKPATHTHVSLHDPWSQEQGLQVLTIIDSYHHISLDCHKAKQNLSVIEQY